ncbi:MAG: hypothetical protein V4629_03880 [Pseudomonadota bacterium]
MGSGISETQPPADGWYGRQSLMDIGFTRAEADAALRAAGGNSEKGVRYEDFISTLSSTSDDDALNETIDGVPLGGYTTMPANLVNSKEVSDNAIDITSSFRSSTLGSSSITNYLNSNAHFEGDTIVLKATKETGAEIRSDFSLDGIKELYFTKDSMGPEQLHSGSFAFNSQSRNEIDFAEELGGKPTDGIHVNAIAGGDRNKVYDQRLDFSGTGLDPSKDAISYKYSFDGNQVTTSVKSAITGEYVQINQFKNSVVQDVVQGGQLMFSAWGEGWHNTPLTSGEVRISDVLVVK